MNRLTNNLLQAELIGLDSDRCTGRTTALAFQYIGQALAKPNTKVRVKDHFGSREADRNLLRRISLIISQTELNHMVIRECDMSLEFELHSPGKPDRIYYKGDFYNRERL